MLTSISTGSRSSCLKERINEKALPAAHLGGDDYRHGAGPRYMLQFLVDCRGKIVPVLRHRYFADAMKASGNA